MIHETFPISSPLKKDIAVLCVARKSNYKLFEGLELYDQSRDAFTYTDTLPVIAHPPCAQWSKLKALAIKDSRQLQLAEFCFNQVTKNGGILEHPAGSSLFEFLKIPKSKLISVNQHWFGFPARKNTLLYFHNYKPLSFPLSFDAITRTVESIHSEDRSIMPPAFCSYLINCIRQDKR